MSYSDPFLKKFKRHEIIFLFDIYISNFVTSIAMIDWFICQCAILLLNCAISFLSWLKKLNDTDIKLKLQYILLLYKNHLKFVILC